MKFWSARLFKKLRHGQNSGPSFPLGRSFVYATARSGYGAQEATVTFCFAKVSCVLPAGRRTARRQSRSDSAL